MQQRRARSAHLRPVSLCIDHAPSQVQLSELSARLHTEQMQHQVAMETVEATVRGLELRTATLQSELSSAQASLTIVQGDYDSYKVRGSCDLVGCHMVVVGR